MRINMSNNIEKTVDLLISIKMYQHYSYLICEDLQRYTKSHSCISFLRIKIDKKI